MMSQSSCITFYALIPMHEVWATEVLQELWGGLTILKLVKLPSDNRLTFNFQIHMPVKQQDIFLPAR